MALCPLPSSLLRPNYSRAEVCAAVVHHNDAEVGVYAAVQIRGPVQRRIQYSSFFMVNNKHATLPQQMNTVLEQNQSTGCMVKHIASVGINRVRLSILHVVS